MLRNGLVVACLITTSCSTYYKPPSSGPAAAIEITNRGIYFAAIAVFDDANGCKGTHLASELYPNQKKEIVIPAGKPIALHYNQRGFTGGPSLELATCDIVATFNPEPGRHYSSELRNSADGCFVTVTASDKRSKKVPVVYRLPKAPFGTSGNWCPPLTLEQGAAIR